MVKGPSWSMAEKTDCWVKRLMAVCSGAGAESGLSVQDVTKIAQYLGERCLNLLGYLLGSFDHAFGGSMVFFSGREHGSVLCNPGRNVLGGGCVVVTLEANDVRPASQTASFYHAIPGGCKQNQIAGQGRLYRLGVPFEKRVRAVDASEKRMALTILGQVAINEAGAAHVPRAERGARSFGDQVHAKIKAKAGAVEVEPGL